MKKIPVFVFGLLLAAPVMTPDARTQTAADREAVRQALLDYVEGIYNVQPERTKSSTRPPAAR